MSGQSRTYSIRTGFTPEQSAERSKYAHFPFIAGPHQCIGGKFAMLRDCLVVAMVLKKFDIELAANQTIEPQASIAIVPKAPVQVVLKRRNALQNDRSRRAHHLA